MRIPLNWLREYVALTVPVPELVERLTLAGLEVGGVRLYGLPVPEGLRLKPAEPGPVWTREHIVTARVLGVEKHPNADKLKLVRLDYGRPEPKVVVTGAPNIAVGDAGQKVILALTGSVLFDGHADPKVMRELKPTVLRGVPSDAMVCSAFELGISDEHEGIILLEEDAPVGVPLADFMGDVVLEADVLPNMARCLALIGVAREVAALTGQTVRLPETDPGAAGEPIDGRVSVSIADPKLCSRYRAVLIRGVKVGPAPGPVQRRLAYAGMRPINNVVDATNYAMLEWGQPLHAFDYDVLRRRAGDQTPSIVVRPARGGEKLKTLDGVDRELTPEHLVIADSAGPIALAGVMGGAETEVSATTTNILLESANFDFASVRRTLRAFNLPSEASARFSKGIHPEVVAPAADRAARLLREWAGGTVCRGAIDVYPAPPPPQVVTLALAEVRRILGIDLPPAEAERTLRALEFGVEPAGPGTLRVTVPPHRLDIQAGTYDLIEELARVHGYDRLPATLPADPLPEQTGNPDLEREERVRDLLAGVGLQEVITYALTAPEREALLLGEPGPADDGYVRLLNPISTDRVAMRRSVLAGVLEVVATNLKHTDTVRVFEVGSVYVPRSGELLPDEPRRLAVAMTGRRDATFWADPPGSAPALLDFFDLKGTLEALARGLHAPAVGVRPAAVPWLHPGQSAELLLGDRPVGRFGTLHPKTARALDLAGRAVLVAELDLEAVLAAVPDRYDYAPLPRYPAALRDVAVVVPEAVTAEQVRAELWSAGRPLLREARLFDVYRGASIPAGTKSLAYALTYQADDRTLTDREVDRAHQQIEGRLTQALGAHIRGKEE